MVQKTGDGDLKLIRVGVLGEDGLQNRVQAFIRFLLVSCFNGIEQLFIAELNETARMIQEKAEAELQLSVSIGISQPFDVLTKAKTAYAEGSEVFAFVSTSNGWLMPMLTDSCSSASAFS